MNRRELITCLQTGDHILSIQRESAVYGASHDYKLRDAQVPVSQALVRKLVNQGKIVFVKHVDSSPYYKWNFREEDHKNGTA